ncbi:hypothetical protein [Amycolatopsis sp. BJA-103]|uniref:hypothetical protein n=1 Tax=Amycolatopsis sp. BJA-103 TaxID=1911175 RepID=UPI000C75C8BC|nr:hypothetical protein [Amycolatopsis sp. BJA-103]AUI56805.1 hypothetical protein BKN51_00310 [Amycolatopsis sp. BJA-103]PNE13448.1 hypothetical protein B1H26_40180 [Amycolatopsis sp. BJA-103]
MVDRSRISAEDALVLGRHTAAEIDAAATRVRAYLDEYQRRAAANSATTDVISNLDTHDGGPRLLASELRVLLADLARARVNLAGLQYRLRGEQHHHANTTTERDQFAARVADAETALLQGSQSNDMRVREALTALAAGLPRCTHGRTTPCDSCGRKSSRREALREMTREAEADGLLDVGTGFIQTRGDEGADRG